MVTRSTVQASWMDASGVRYAVPVNSQKPQTSGYLYLSYSRPITKDRQEIGSELSYRFYRGYANGFGLPEWRWNMSVST